MHVYTQNGEEDTVLRDDLKRVKKKLSLTFAIAIIGTCVVFGLLYYLGIDLLNNYIEGTSHLIYDNEKPYIDDERVIIRTKLEKPSKIKGLALI